MIKIRMHWFMAVLLLLMSVPGLGQTQKSPVELPSLGSDPVQAPGTQVKPVGAPQDPPSTDKRVAGFAEMQQAREAFEEFIRAYETGNVLLIQRRLDPAMIGYQQFLDGVRSDTATYRQTRILLTDTQITAGPDVAVIQTGWEKRALNSATFQPQLNRGRSQILLHRGANGWQLVAFAGDNMFANNAGTVAQLSVTPATFISGNAPPDVIINVPILIQVIDPDLAGQPSVNVQIRSSQGDSEIVTLPATGPGGTFSVSSLRMRRNSLPGFAPGNGIAEFNAPPAINFTITYIDALPATTLIRIINGI